MTALTPGCDPDMSVTGAPFGAAAGGGPRVRSWLVLIAVVALSALLATADAVPGPVGVPAAVVGVLCALVLVRRVVRLVHHATARVTPGARGSGRRRPVGAAT